MLAFLHQLDLRVLFLLNGLVGRSSVLDGVLYACAVYLAPALILFFLIFLFRSPFAMKEKARLLFVVVVAEIVSRVGALNGIQIFYDRPRPYVEFANNIHSLFTVNAYSFPSGHATFFFTLAFVVWFYNRTWGAWFLAATILMTAGRVAAGVHYPSDILGGALIGFIVAWIVYSVSRKFSHSTNLRA